MRAEEPRRGVGDVGQDLLSRLNTRGQVGIGEAIPFGVCDLAGW